MIELIALIFIVLIFLFLFIYLPFFSPAFQILGKVVYRLNIGDKKIVALTFDDGPNEPYTSQILDILDKYNIKATFFLVGENILKNKELTKKINNDGHIIGNHSYSHAFFASLFLSNYKNEIEKSQKLITDITGKKPILFRPPWLFRTPMILKTANRFNLTTITGTFCSYWEVFKVNPKIIAHDAIKNTNPGTILIFHDGFNNKGTNRSKTVQALEITIPQLLKKGYKFVTVPQLLEAK